MDMYSRVKRRKSMRRSTFSMPAHHKVLSKAEQEEEEEEGTEGKFPSLMFYLWISGEKSTSSLTVLIKMSKLDTFIVYYAYLKFE